MADFLYRFRTSDALIGMRQELQNQEIYFSAPEQLNDPVEGFKDIFWAGDAVVWKNFLNHYLLCLEQICVSFLISSTENKITAADIPVFKTIQDFPTAQYKVMYLEAWDLFFSNPLIAQYPKWLSSRTGPIRRDELNFYLRHLHYHALNSIFTVYEKNGMMATRPSTDALHRIAESEIIKEDAFQMINQVEAEHPEKKDIADIIYAAQKHLYSQIDWMQHYKNPTFANDYNRRLIFLEFPEKYLQQLEKIVHQDWYTACFLEEYHNPAMWGHYGSNHTGICLKFRTTETAHQPFLKLYGINGWGGSREKSGPTYGDVIHYFHKVEYTKTYPEIDFFRSLGRLPIPTLHVGWYMDAEGNKSSCADDIFKSEETWREKYWSGFYKGITTKLEDWAYEKEYRLILSSASDYTDPTNRKLKFKLQDLEGIIFGIKTSEQDKKAIMKLIGQKCRAEGRIEFKFYQAYYARQTGRIEAAEMNLFKF